jgi:hypothetical protein
VRGAGAGAARRAPTCSVIELAAHALRKRKDAATDAGGRSRLIDGVVVRYQQPIEDRRGECSSLPPVVGPARIHSSTSTGALRPGASRLGHPRAPDDRLSVTGVRAGDSTTAPRSPTQAW